jgi:hypothetical protein
MKFPGNQCKECTLVERVVVDEKFQSTPSRIALILESGSAVLKTVDLPQLAQITDLR